MSKQIEFFYDYVSSYSYLANSQVQALFGDRLVYRPMLLGAVMNETGNKPPAMVPARGAYLARDLQRWAAFYGIPFRMNPQFPQNTLGALRLAVLAQHEGGFGKVHQPLFDAMWVHEKNLSDPDVLAEIAANAGMDADQALVRSNDDAIKAEVKANTDEAIRRGAFGAPTFFVGDEMFFGNDRLAFAKAALDGE